MGSLVNKGFVFDARVPYYLQLKGILEEKIGRQELKAGDKLPSEAEICEEMRVSRTVVRQALKDLEYEGRVVKRKGKGTFVSEAKILETFVQRLSGFHQDITSQALSTHSKVLRCEVMAISGRIAKILHVRPGSKVVLLRRLRFVGDDPIQLVTSYLPYKLCPGIVEVDFQEESLYGYLESKGTFIARGFRTVEAVGASTEDAKRLNVHKGSPMIRIESVVYSADGTPVEYYEATHRGDRTRFRVELVRRRTRAVQGNAEGSVDGEATAFGVEVLGPTTPRRRGGRSKGD